LEGGALADTEFVKVKFAESIANALAVFVLTAAAAVLTPLKLPWVITAAAIACTSALVILILQVSRSQIRRIGPLRRWIWSAPAGYEGYWAQSTDIPERPYSIAKIYYDSELRVWTYRGFAFTLAGEVWAEWKVRSIVFEPLRREWFFDGLWGECDAAMLNSGSESHMKQTQFCQLSLVRGFQKCRASGVVVDIPAKDPTASFRVYMRRISPEMFKAHMSVRSVERIAMIPPTIALAMVKDVWATSK
jgi:hypothetical protein